MECAECGQRLGPPPRTGRPRRYCSRACQGRSYRRRRDEGRLAEAVRTAATDPQARSTVEVAVALADAEGIGAVTLRVVAHRAGTALAAVHHDFGSRDRLVAAMVQRVLAARATRAAPDDATSALTELAEDEWQAYVAHPWLVEVMASSRPPLVPAVLDGARASIEAFRRAGLDGETAFTRYLALSGYVQGMALVLAAEQRETVRTGTSYRAWWREELRRLDRTGAVLRRPWIADLAAPAPRETPDAATAFREGLERLVPALLGA